MRFAEEEKIFIACFVMGGYTIFKPKYKNYISLYSYLDLTSETLEDQNHQLISHDPYFVSLLRPFANCPDFGRTGNQNILKTVSDELRELGFFENEKFKARFGRVANWLMSYRSDLYINEAASAFNHWSNIEENRLRRGDKTFLSNKLSNLITHNEKLNKRLSKNPLLDDDPNWWREQE
jgi:hypothetical protein